MIESILIYKKRTQFCLSFLEARSFFFLSKFIQIKKQNYICTVEWWKDSYLRKLSSPTICLLPLHKLINQPNLSIQCGQMYRFLYWDDTYRYWHMLVRCRINNNIEIHFSVFLIYLWKTKRLKRREINKIRPVWYTLTLVLLTN